MTTFMIAAAAFSAGAVIAIIAMALCVMAREVDQEYGNEE